MYEDMAPSYKQTASIVDEVAKLDRSELPFGIVLWMWIQSSWSEWWSIGCSERCVCSRPLKPAGSGTERDSGLSVWWFGNSSMVYIKQLSNNKPELISYFAFSGDQLELADDKENPEFDLDQMYALGWLSPKKMEMSYRICSMDWFKMSVATHSMSVPKWTVLRVNSISSFYMG